MDSMHQPTLAARQQARPDGRDSRLHFFGNAMAFSQKIRGASDAGQFLQEVGRAICDLFECESMVLYGVSEDYGGLVGKSVV